MKPGVTILEWVDGGNVAMMTGRGRMMDGKGEGGAIMLGDRYLVAPVVVKGAVSRQVCLSKGTWKDETGKTFRGPKTIEVAAPLERLPWYEKIR